MSIMSPATFGAAIAVSLLSVSVSAQAQSYPVGYTWDRSTDWVIGTSAGTSAGNPSPDRQGSKVWRYEWTVGGSMLTTNPWFLGPKSLMVWDDYWWGTQSQNNWARGYLGAGSDNNVNPPISRWTLAHDLSEYKKSVGYMPIVRWINPVIGYNEFSISGNMQVEWAGWGVSPDVDVEVVIGKKDEVSGKFSVVWAQTVSNPTPRTVNPPYPKVTIPLSIPLIRMNKNDGLLFTVRAKRDTAFAEPNWVVLYDNPVITLLRSSRIPY